MISVDRKQLEWQAVKIRYLASDQGLHNLSFIQHFRQIDTLHLCVMAVKPILSYSIIYIFWAQLFKTNDVVS